MIKISNRKKYNKKLFYLKKILKSYFFTAGVKSISKIYNYTISTEKYYFLIFRNCNNIVNKTFMMLNKFILLEG
jgi:hypothetical protein